MGKTNACTAEHQCYAHHAFVRQWPCKEHNPWILEWVEFLTESKNSCLTVNTEIIIIIIIMYSAVAGFSVAEWERLSERTVYYSGVQLLQQRPMLLMRLSVTPAPCIVWQRSVYSYETRALQVVCDHVMLPWQPTTWQTVCCSSFCCASFWSQIDLTARCRKRQPDIRWVSAS